MSVQLKCGGSAQALNRACTPVWPTMRRGAPSARDGASTSAHSPPVLPTHPQRQSPPPPSLSTPPSSCHWCTQGHAHTGPCLSARVLSQHCSCGASSDLCARATGAGRVSRPSTSTAARRLGGRSSFAHRQRLCMSVRRRASAIRCARGGCVAHARCGHARCGHARCGHDRGGHARCGHPRTSGHLFESRSDVPSDCPSWRWAQSPSCS